MIQLTSKELRFSDLAVTAALNEHERTAWHEWYSGSDFEKRPISGLYSIPVHLINVLITAISTEKSRLNTAIENANGDDPDLVNDLEMFINIEGELKQKINI